VLFHSRRVNTCFGKTTGFMCTEAPAMEVLQDFAKHENFQDLLLECAWKQTEMWQTPEHRDALDNLIKGVMDAPTPRRTFFQAFMSLLKLHNKTETPPEFSKVCDEAIQLSIRKWHHYQSALRTLIFRCCRISSNSLSFMTRASFVRVCADQPRKS